MLVVDLFEQVLDIALDAFLGHGRQNRLDRLCLCKLVELLAAMHTGKLQDETEPECRILLYCGLNIICL